MEIMHIPAFTGEETRGGMKHRRRIPRVGHAPLALDRAKLQAFGAAMGKGGPHALDILRFGDAYPVRGVARWKSGAPFFA